MKVFPKQINGNPFASGAGHIDHYGYSEGDGYGYGQFYGDRSGCSYTNLLDFSFQLGDGNKRYPWMLVQYWKE